MRISSLKYLSLSLFLLMGLLEGGEGAGGCRRRDMERGEGLDLVWMWLGEVSAALERGILAVVRSGQRRWLSGWIGGWGDLGEREVVAVHLRRGVGAATVRSGER